MATKSNRPGNPGAVQSEDPSRSVDSRNEAPVKRTMADSVRDFISEWSLNIIILLFGTTTLVQAFIVPTPSMDTTVRVGDHLLVDKLSYAPSGSFSRLFLPYTEPKRGDIIVFRYPMDISQNYVKRVMGVPGDHIKVVDKAVYLKTVTSWTNLTRSTFFPTCNRIAIISRASHLGR